MVHNRPGESWDKPISAVAQLCPNPAEDAFALWRICRVSCWESRGNKSGSGCARSLTATLGSVRFTLSGYRILAKPMQLKNPLSKLFETTRVYKHAKRIRHFVNWFPHEYVLLCTLGALIIELNKPRLPMDNLVLFDWARAGSHRKQQRDQQLYCLGPGKLCRKWNLDLPVTCKTYFEI